MNYISINTILFFQGITRVRQVLLTKIILVVGVMVLTSCTTKVANSKEISNLKVAATELSLQPLEGKWYYKQTPFNGYAVSYHPNGTLAKQIGYYNGKKQGTANYWYEDGTLLRTSNYVENQLDGTLTSWWPNGTKSATSFYKKGVRQGEQQKWYASGQLARKTQFANGKENGLQQAWLENGSLYVNYEAKNGRFFGLKRSNLCYKLKDEKVQYN